MSLTPLVAVLKSQVAVIAATLVVGVSAIGMATTGSPNPKVWGADLMGSIQRSAPTTTTTTPGPTPTPEGTPTSGAPLTINSASSPEPKDTPEASASPEPRETPEAVASPEPRETPEPTATPESNGGDGSGDD